MFPSSAMTSITNSGTRNAIHFTYSHEGFSVFSQLANFYNVVLGQNGSTVFLAIGLSKTSNHIGRVFFWSPEIKMVRIATGGIITFVEYLKSFWNGTVAKSISQSVGAPTLIQNDEKAITAGKGIACPNPATIVAALINSIPKAFVPLMSLNIFTWLSLDNISYTKGSWRQPGFESTSTMTKAVWDVLIWVWNKWREVGRITHISISFEDIGHAPGRLLAAGAFCSHNYITIKGVR